MPACGGWSWPHVGEDNGWLIDLLDVDLNTLIEDHRVTHLVYEAPILVVRGRRGSQRTDRLEVIRKLYGMGDHVEWVCRRRGIYCREVEIQDSKKELAGFAQAEKSDMVAAAEKIGMVLPPGKLAEDAADAFGAWLLLLRAHSRQMSERFDKALWGARGALL